MYIVYKFSCLIFVLRLPHKNILTTNISQITVILMSKKGLTDGQNVEDKVS